MGPGRSRRGRRRRGSVPAAPPVATRRLGGVAHGRVNRRRTTSTDAAAVQAACSPQIGPWPVAGDGLKTRGPAPWRRAGGGGHGLSTAVPASAGCVAGVGRERPRAAAQPAPRPARWLSPSRWRGLTGEPGPSGLERSSHRCPPGGRVGVLGGGDRRVPPVCAGLGPCRSPMAVAWGGEAGSSHRRHDLASLVPASGAPGSDKVGCDEQPGTAPARAGRSDASGRVPGIGVGRLIMDPWLSRAQATARSSHQTDAAPKMVWTTGYTSVL